MYNINNIINYFILFLIIYLPIESFFLKLISFNDFTFLFLSQLPEVFLFFLFILKQFHSNKYFNYHKIIIFFISFLIIYVFGLVFYWESSLFASLNNLKAFLRFIFLIFLINKQSLKMIKTFLKAIIFSGLLQVIAGLFQIAIGQPALTFFSPYDLVDNQVFTSKFTALRTDSLNIFGTSSQNINYALFLLVTFLVNINFSRLFNRYLFNFMNITIPLCVYFSGSRTVFLSIIICYFIHHYLNRSLAKKLLFIAPILFVTFIIIYLLGVELGSSSYSDFSFIFSGNLISVLQIQRLGFLEVFYENFFSINFFGYSSDKEFLAEYLARNFQIPIQLKLSTLILIEDVYFLAFFLYYGLINFIFLILVLVYIYMKVKNGNTSKDSYKRLVFLAQNILLISIIINLFNQGFEIRLFSFYYWLFISITLFALETENENSVST